MQGSTIASENVAFCSTDVNSTTGLDYLMYGGEGRIRTHGWVSPTHAFQACSFNHSDTSPSSRLSRAEINRLPTRAAINCGLLRTFLFPTREKTLEVFWALLPIGFRSGPQKSITNLSYAPTFLRSDLLKKLLQVGVNTKRQPGVLSHWRRILPSFRY